jgi:hypothetical protein
VIVFIKIARLRTLPRSRNPKLSSFCIICPNRQSNFASLIASIMPTTISNENKYIYRFLLCLPRRQRIDLIQYRRSLILTKGESAWSCINYVPFFFGEMPSISQAFLSQELMFLAYNLNRAGGDLCLRLTIPALGLRLGVLRTRGRKCWTCLLLYCWCYGYLA